MLTGILGAMPEEVGALASALENPRSKVRAGRAFTSGRLAGADVMVAFSRWGKVAAASTATELLLVHGVERLIFTGIAGGLDPELGIGDIVVARDLYQHDLDASPFFKPGEIPLLGVSAIPADPGLSSRLLEAASAFLRHEAAAALPPDLAPVLAGRPRRAIMGDVATGDQVIASGERRAAVLARVPSASCVEMEGAAVAQVCHEHGIPFACIRTISDGADEHVERWLPRFLGGLAAAYSLGIIRRWLGLPGPG